MGNCLWEGCVDAAEDGRPYCFKHRGLRGRSRPGVENDHFSITEADESDEVRHRTRDAEYPATERDETPQEPGADY